MSRVLVVDDRQSNREVLSTLLSYKNYDVSEANNGREALDRFRTESFDLIITDLLMPEVDGYELVRQVRGNDTIDQPSIIFYSGHYLEGESRKLAMACGVNFIIEKPCHPEKILATVARALEELAIRRPAISPQSALFDQDHVHLLTDKLHEKIAELETTNVELTESKRALSLLMSHLPGMAYRFRLTKERNFEFASEGALELTGYTAKELILNTPTYLSLIHADDRELVWDQIQKSIRLKTPYKLIYRIRDRSGHEKWVWEQGMPITDASGKSIALEGFISDVSERQPSEEKLNETLREVAKANSELQKFAYVASHDLKEPLRTVSSYVSLLSKRYRGRFDSDADEFIDFAISGAKRMSDLIDALLTYAKVSQTELAFKVTPLLDVINLIKEDLKVSIEESKAEITTDPLPMVAADVPQLCRVFRNLISNAIKFSGGSPPKIHLSAEEKDNDWIISVRDEGIGFDNEFRDRIFVIFQRLHPVNHYAGTGIGLAITKKIVEQHGGEIWADSKPGQGSTFSFTMPRVA